MPTLVFETTFDLEKISIMQFLQPVLVQHIFNPKVIFKGIFYFK